MIQELRLNREAINSLSPECLIELVRVATGGLRAGFADVGRGVAMCDAETDETSEFLGFLLQVGDRFVVWSIEDAEVAEVEVHRADFCPENHLSEWLSGLARQREGQRHCITQLIGRRKVSVV